MESHLVTHLNHLRKLSDDDGVSMAKFLILLLFPENVSIMDTQFLMCNGDLFCNL